MCSQNTNTTVTITTTSGGGATARRMQTRSMIKKLTQQNNTNNITTKSCLGARRTRTKTRKPKYLSLLRLKPPPENSRSPTAATQKNKRHKQPRKHQEKSLRVDVKHMHQVEKDMHMHMQINLHEHHEDNNVAFLFESSYSSATTLNELLSATTTATTNTDDGVGFNRGRDQSDGACSTLVRTAMKGKVRDLSEEKWVMYSEVVEKKDEEVSSCCVNNNSNNNGGLCLKLDYEEILNAWSDKGSLFIDGETHSRSQSPQVVPDLFPNSKSNVLMDGWGSAGNIWQVPDLGGGSFGGSMAKGEVGEGFVMGRREASVLRYKEKRRNRLFSKRIRYEVRKLNAEKRPRMKGRFVKRS